MSKKITLEECIKELGEIPYCQCGCRNKVIIFTRRYNQYKKNGYPKYLDGHQVKGKHWKLSKEFKLNQSIRRKGIKLSEEHKLSMRIKFNTEEINKIIELYNQRLSLVEIGKIFKVTKPTIRRILKENNIKIRTTGESLIGKISKVLGIPKTQEHKDKQSEIMKTKLLDRTWYPCIPIICYCGCNEIVYGNHKYVYGHQLKILIKSDKHKLKIGKSNKGKKRTEEQNKINSDKIKEYYQKHPERKEELSKEHLGIPLSEIHKLHIKENIPRGENHSKPWLGKHLSEEHKLNIKKNHPHLSGKNHPSYGKGGNKHWNWKGGITSLHEIIRHCEQNKNWIKSVFKRDNFTCQECNKLGKGNIVAHHIKQFSNIIKEFNITTLEQAIQCEQLWDLNNGKTLCKKCHDKIPIIR